VIALDAGIGSGESLPIGTPDGGPLEDEMTPTTTTTIELPLTLAEAADHLRAFELDLRARFLEREGEIRGLILAAVARCNLLLLGPPGTAKSALTVAFSEALGWTSFVRLLGKTTVPEELFGPYSLAGLEHDRFERCVDGYLPTSQVVFLDEVFKANSAILNALLTALNERAFDQGNKRIRIPMEVAVGASNEYPSEDGLAALYDRFLLRFWTDYLKSEASFEAMLVAESKPIPRLDREAIEVLRAAADGVDVSKIVPLIVKIRGELARDCGVVVSDRRWRQAMTLIRASAVLDGRTAATPRDLSVLADTLWDRKDQRDVILATVTKHRSAALAKITEILKLATEEMGQLPNLSTLKIVDVAKAGNGVDKLNKFINEANGIAAAEAREMGEEDPEVTETIAKIEALKTELRTAINRAMTRS
jgi:MoxR-like ATPase